RTHRVVDGSRVDAQRLSDQRSCRPHPPGYRAARGPGYDHQRDPRIHRTAVAQAMDVIDARAQVSEARLIEDRTYPPSAAFRAQANVTGDVYAQADADPIAFWEEAARRLDWATPWHTALDWQPPTDDMIPA